MRYGDAMTKFWREHEGLAAFLTVVLAAAAPLLLVTLILFVTEFLSPLVFGR
jgi:uncharacterized paraquat-inducible protein A